MRYIQGMKITIPSGTDVRAWLSPLTNTELQQLGERSGVPFTTLWKIRAGETKNPGVETVRKIAPHVAQVTG